MVQCEMCGTETASPTTAKIEGAELQVCDSCADFGTEVSSADASSTTSKYSTESGSSSDSTSGATSASGSGDTRSGGGGGSRRDMFDEIETLADDYPARIRDARESRSLSQQELAQELNEKASLIRKLERGDMQPNDNIQRKLERKLDISLNAGEGDDDADWESDVAPGETTLGDVVRRGE